MHISRADVHYLLGTLEMILHNYIHVDIYAEYSIIAWSSNVVVGYSIIRHPIHSQCQSLCVEIKSTEYCSVYQESEQLFAVFIVGI